MDDPITFSAWIKWVTGTQQSEAKLAGIYTLLQQQVTSPHDLAVDRIRERLNLPVDFAIPATVEETTAAFLTAVFHRAGVLPHGSTIGAAIESRLIGEGRGYAVRLLLSLGCLPHTVLCSLCGCDSELSFVARFDFSIAGPPGECPLSCVGKFFPHSKADHYHAVARAQFIGECSINKELPAAVCPRPICYLAQDDLLVFETMSDSSCMDQFQPQTVPMMKRILKATAVIHGRTWGGRPEFGRGGTCGFGQNMPKFFTLEGILGIAEQMPCENLAFASKEAFGTEISELVEISQLIALKQKNLYLHAMDRQPLCMAFGDLRLNNIFFSDKFEHGVMFCDTGFCSWACPWWELCYVLQCSMSADDLELHEDDLLRLTSMSSNRASVSARALSSL